MGLALNLRSIVGQLLQLDIVGNGPQLKHNAGTMEMRNSTDTGFVITRGLDPVGNNDFVTKGAGDLAYWRSVNPNWLVTDWYIDGVTGDDANSGTVVGSPIKTGAELVKRLGPYAMWPQSVTVHVLANGMTDALVLYGELLVKGTHLEIVGTPTVLASDTVANWQVASHAVPTGNHLTGTVIADFTPYARKRIQVTNGARLGTITWIAKAAPGGLGLNVARVTYTLIQNQISTTAPVTQAAALVAGDLFDVQSLPLIPAIRLTVDGPLSNVGAMYTRRHCTVSHVDCPNIRIDDSGSALRGLSYLFGCRVSEVFFIGLYGQVQFSATPVMGCSFYATDNQLYVFQGSVNSLFGDGHTQTLLQTSMLNRQCLFQGTNLSSRVYQEGDDNQIFDVANVAAGAFVCQFAFYKNTSGDGNLGFGAFVSNNANYRCTVTWNVKGAVSDVQLGAAPAINLTIAQFLQPDDYAQKGITPAMVAGTTTVTVPWYNNATQQVTVSHAAFAGTPGILSVQQISTTQFTITSSSALDTSTVNWTISPLGRNIFISTV